jgi:drug/metabolite transporter (DMT)-like permease
MFFALMLFPDERGLLRSPFFWVGFPLCITGVVGVLVFRAGFEVTATTIGVLLTLGCAFCWGAYTVSVRYFLADVGTRIGFAVIAIYTTAILILLAALLGDPAAALRMPLPAWISLVGSALLGIALGHVLYYVAIRKVGATISALFLLITPLGAYAVSSQIFGSPWGLDSGRLELCF